MNRFQNTVPVMGPSDIITPDELCVRLRVKRSWIYERTRMGKPLPNYRVGRCLRFNWNEITAWLEKHHRECQMGCGRTARAKG